MINCKVFQSVEDAHWLCSLSNAVTLQEQNKCCKGHLCGFESHHNHEVWKRCKSCGYYYDLRNDELCPICMQLNIN